MSLEWAAGLFEGEGSITFRPYPGRKTYQRHLRLFMTDRDVVVRFHAAVGCGQVTFVNRRFDHYKDGWRWTCNRWEDIERVLRAFLPLLARRRRRAAERLLAHPAGPVGGPRKELCKRGHPLEGPGSDVYERNGVRHCRHCSRVRNGTDLGYRPRGHKRGCACRPCTGLDSRS